MDSHFDFSSVVKPNIVALKILGFWKSSDPNSIFNTVWYRSYTVTVVLLNIMFEATGLLYLYDKWDSLSLLDINSVIYVYSTGVINCGMMVLIFFHIECLHFIQTTMTSQIFRPKSQAQAADARKWKSTARCFQNLFCCGNMFITITVILVAVWRKEKVIIVAHKPAILHWKIFFVFQAAMLTTSPQMCVTYVTLITGLLVEIIIQLRLLEKTLEDVKDNEGIRLCVEWHLQILVFAKKVQRFCGIGVSSVLFCGIINICASLSLLMEVDYVDLLFLFPYFVDMLIIVYCQCWCGSEVVYQSQKMSSAVYNSPWTNADESHRKNIKMYMLLTQKPLEIHLGGGITTASLPVFVAVVKSAYSAFAILQRFK